MPILELPDIRQPTEYGCGTTAAEVLLRYDGLVAGLWLRKLADPIVGTEAETLSAILNGAYSGRRLGGSMTVETLKHLTTEGRPVICLVTEPEGMGHWVVVAGVARRNIYFHCPTNGPSKERIELFEARWKWGTPGLGSGYLVRYGLTGFLE